MIKLKFVSGEDVFEYEGHLSDLPAAVAETREVFTANANLQAAIDAKTAQLKAANDKLEEKANQPTP